MVIEGAGGERPSLDQLIRELQRLHIDRARHVQAIATIDATLQRIRRTLPRDTPFDDALLPTSRRKYRKLDQTGREFVLDFLRRHGSATARQVNRAWHAEGRGGVANNTLVDLQKDGLIERTVIPGQRGGTYHLRRKYQE
jgi:hypothetical protein